VGPAWNDMCMQQRIETFDMAKGGKLICEPIIHCERDCISRDRCDCPRAVVKDWTQLQRNLRSRVSVGPSSSHNQELSTGANRRGGACLKRRVEFS
jgi:hypothetical protein